MEQKVLKVPDDEKILKIIQNNLALADFKDSQSNDPISPSQIYGLVINRFFITSKIPEIPIISNITCRIEINGKPGKIISKASNTWLRQNYSNFLVMIPFEDEKETVTNPQIELVCNPGRKKANYYIINKLRSNDKKFDVRLLKNVLIMHNKQGKAFIEFQNDQNYKLWNGSPIVSLEDGKVCIYGLYSDQLSAPNMKRKCQIFSSVTVFHSFEEKCKSHSDLIHSLKEIKNMSELEHLIGELQQKHLDYCQKLVDRPRSRFSAQYMFQDDKITQSQNQTSINPQVNLTEGEEAYNDATQQENNDYFQSRPYSTQEKVEQSSMSESLQEDSHFFTESNNQQNLAAEIFQHSKKFRQENSQASHSCDNLKKLEMLIKNGKYLEIILGSMDIIDDELQKNKMSSRLFSIYSVRNTLVGKYWNVDGKIKLQNVNFHDLDKIDLVKTVKKLKKNCTRNHLSQLLGIYKEFLRLQESVPSNREPFQKILNGLKKVFQKVDALVFDRSSDEQLEKYFRDTIEIIQSIPFSLKVQFYEATFSIKKVKQFNTGSLERNEILSIRRALFQRFEETIKYISTRKYICIAQFTYPTRINDSSFKYFSRKSEVGKNGNDKSQYAKGMEEKIKQYPKVFIECLTVSILQLELDGFTQHDIKMSNFIFTAGHVVMQTQIGNRKVAYKTLGKRFQMIDFDHASYFPDSKQINNENAELYKKNRALLELNMKCYQPSAHDNSKQNLKQNRLFLQNYDKFLELLGKDIQQWEKAIRSHRFKSHRQQYLTLVCKVLEQGDNLDQKEKENLKTLLSKLQKEPESNQSFKTYQEILEKVKTGYISQIDV